jgi:hypothetical protein
MGRNLPKTKVICIESMLLDGVALSTIAATLEVSYNAVYYHKQRLDLVGSVPASAVAATVGQKRIFGPGIDEVLWFN